MEREVHAFQFTSSETQFLVAGAGRRRREVHSLNTTPQQVTLLDSVRNREVSSMLSMTDGRKEEQLERRLQRALDLNDRSQGMQQLRRSWTILDIFE
ncbi:MAG: hypothetical protein C4K49_03850 [Candidatus Thorarchaeota archaeon]|nr:MAG: hypothetical protein C4K49_03850 [Candidatus Thorarchaeota archaeon]